MRLYWPQSLFRYRRVRRAELDDSILSPLMGLRTQRVITIILVFNILLICGLDLGFDVFEPMFRIVVPLVAPFDWLVLNHTDLALGLDYDRILFVAVMMPLSAIVSLLGLMSAVSNSRDDIAQLAVVFARRQVRRRASVRLAARQRRRLPFRFTYLTRRQTIRMYLSMLAGMLLLFVAFFGMPVYAHPRDQLAILHDSAHDGFLILQAVIAAFASICFYPGLLLSAFEVQMSRRPNQKRLRMLLRRARGPSTWRELQAGRDEEGIYIASKRAPDFRRDL